MSAESVHYSQYIKWFAEKRNLPVSCAFAVLLALIPFITDKK
jgi:hypothetical protein